MKLEDLTGFMFGKLTVLRRDVSSHKKVVKWICRCECGTERSIWRGDLNETPSINLGLTARDYFAAKAMQGFLAMSPSIKAPDGTQESFNTGAEGHCDICAKAAYKIADAMLRARGN